MANPQIIQSGFRAGMKRDFARDDMPKDSLWNMVDFIPDAMGAKLRKRGGLIYASQDLHVVDAGTTHITAGIVASYTDGQSILAFGDAGRAFEVESLTGTENIGAALATRNPVFYSNMVIVPDAAAAVGPKKITRAAGAHTIANLAGTPPAGKYAVIYKDVLWLASSAALPDRIYFGKAGDPETWDTTNKWLDASYPITGMAALANAVFVFTLERTMRVRGSIPPPDSDFIVDDPLFDVGCTDNRSIANYRDKVIWANAQGLYISDGTAMEDLTRICGMKAWWKNVMLGKEGFFTGSVYSPSSWRIIGGVYGDYYFYSIHNDSAGTVDGGWIDLVRYTWGRFSIAPRVGAFIQRKYPEELFVGHIAVARVSSGSSFFQPVVANQQDPDGTDIAPYIETPYVRDPRLKTMRRLFLGYDLRYTGVSLPTLGVSYILSPESTSYTSITSTLGLTTGATRVHVPINKPSSGIAFKILQFGSSSDTRLYELELEANTREGMKS